MNPYLETLAQKKILIVENFLSKDECQEILEELEYTYWGKSSVVKYNGDEHSPAYYSNIRKSETSGQIWFSDELNSYLDAIEVKLSKLLDISIPNIEEWQATKYGTNDLFDYHVDCGNWAQSKSGERKKTILLYMDTPQKGGETHFRALNEVVKAEAGKLLVWENLLPNGNCNYGMIHSGMPVIEGTKTILVTWERQRPIKI